MNRRNSRPDMYLSAICVALGIMGGGHAISQPPTVVSPAAPTPGEPATATATAAATPAPSSELKSFTARYRVEYFGITAGTADISLIAQGMGRYEYRTTLHPGFIASFRIPDGASLATWVEVNGTSVRPLRYREEDGTKDTDDDVVLDFDWEHAVVQGTAHNSSVRLALGDGTQDPLSMQVAVLCDFANQRVPTQYSMVDKTKIKVYDYQREGVARLRTALGVLDTVVFTNSRPGSNKLTRFWYAPALDYVTVRSEDLVDGKLRTRMTIQSLKR